MKEKHVMIGTIPLQFPLGGPTELLGEGFHTMIGGVPVKLGLPEPGEAPGTLQAPAVAARYGLTEDWGTMDGDTVCVRSLFYACQATEEEAETLIRNSTEWRCKLEDLYLLKTALTQPLRYDRENRTAGMTMFRMEEDGTLTPLHRDREETGPEQNISGIPLDRDQLEKLLEEAASAEVIRQPYTVFLSACRALIRGDCYSAGVLGGTAAELAGGEYIAVHSETVSPHVQELMLGNAREEQFEQLAQLGLIIPDDSENRIIGVYTDMRYGRLTPDRKTLERFLLDCGTVLQLCIPDYLVP